MRNTQCYTFGYMSFKIPVLYGSIREGRKSEPAGRLVHAELFEARRGIRVRDAGKIPVS